MMNEESGKFDLRERTKEFALRIVHLYCSLPKTTEAQVLGKQLLRSGTSVGAHYREAMRARSSVEFVSKIEAGYKNLKRLPIGSNSSLPATSFPKRGSSTYAKKPTK